MAKIYKIGDMEKDLGLKSKNKKELIEKFEQIGYSSVKDKNSEVTEGMFNVYMQSTLDSYSINVSIEDYLSGKLSIKGFEHKKDSVDEVSMKSSATASTVSDSADVKKAKTAKEKPVRDVKEENKTVAPAVTKSEQESLTKETTKAIQEPSNQEAVKTKQETPKHEAAKTKQAPVKQESKKKEQSPQRVFVPPTQQQTKPKFNQRPNTQLRPNTNVQRPNQGVKPTGGVEFNTEIKRNVNPKARIVDTRGTTVDLSKYDEKLEKLAQVASKSFANTRGGKIADNRGKKNVKSEKDKEKFEQDRLRKLQMEQARKLPVSVMIPDEITVGELALRLKITSGALIKKLFMLGVGATVNQTIDFDTAYLIADEMGAKVTREVVVTIEEKLFEETDDKDEVLEERAPVVCVMGHVDHGKTSLLDAIRHTKVTTGEAGGITQHIGAYSVNINGKNITFLDTPGHEAFTAMRARGAKSTDIAILVVAADDGIMPQTIEAINHAKSAGIEIIVAINKMDKQDANPENIKQALTQYELVPEEWGGDVICVPVSALTGEGIDNLLETILLISEIKEYKANPNKRAKGIIIEAKLDKGRGPVVTVLVQNGTLRSGDVVIAGTAVGRVRAMMNDTGDLVKEAGPSIPVEIIGLSEVPAAGDEFNTVEDERMARELAEQRKSKIKEDSFKSNAKVNLESLFDSFNDGTKELNIIVKADVQGSAEAVKSSLLKLSNDEVKINIIHTGVGGIVESDIMLASVSNAIVVGFNVRPDKNALDTADRHKVDFRTYRVIYDCIEEISAAMKGMLAPTYKESVIGHAEVRQTIRVPNIGIIAGCYITDGKAVRNCYMRILRDSVVLCEDKLSSLRRFKDDVKEVASGFECGIGIEKFNDIQEGDILEFYEMVEVKR